MVSLGANVAIAVVKLVGALMTGSGSMLAEALHSVADSGNEALLLWGRREAKQPPRQRIRWARVRDLLLVLHRRLVAFQHGWRGVGLRGNSKLSAGETVQSPWLAIGILVFDSVAEAISLYVPLRQINRVRGKRSLWHWFRTTRRASSSSSSARTRPRSPASASRLWPSC